MMGPRQEAQPALFYEVSLEDHVPPDHLLRPSDRVVDLSGIRSCLAGFCSHTGRPSVDPELLIRMLLVGYCFGIRSERQLCEEVHVNLAYRWFCRLDLSDRVPDHSTFWKNRHGRFCESELLRHFFDTTVGRCIEEGLVSGQLMATPACRQGIQVRLGIEPTSRVIAAQCTAGQWIVSEPRRLSASLSPGQFLVLQAGRSAHAAQLPRWIREMNPSAGLCDRASLIWKWP